MILYIVTPTRAPTPTPSPALGKLGVAYQVVTEQFASNKNLTVNYGAYILEVADDKPAAAAGIKVGDVITEVDGDKVDAKRTLAMRMMPYNTGDELILTVVRGGETIEITVLLVNPRGIAWNTGDTA